MGINKRKLFSMYIYYIHKYFLNIRILEILTKKLENLTEVKIGFRFNWV